MGKGCGTMALVLLGHRRLSIIDLSKTGAQPFHNDERDNHIIFNGEIYNYKELRDILFLRLSLCTTSDTEVILASYDYYGKEFLKHLRGMFAFVLYDKKKNKIIIARDRMGKKPLYLYFDDQRFVVVSELKSFHAFREISLSLDEESLEAYFALQYIPGPYTVYKNVYRLSPGGWAEIDLHLWKYSEQSYWAPYDDISNIKDCSIETLDQAIAESVRYRLIADVEVGVLLSGGIDSSLITAYAYKNIGSALRAFTVSFGQSDLDESFYARTVANELGIRLIQIEGQSISSALFEHVMFHTDEPLGDPACIPTYMISKELSNYVKVVLSGEGADELFWGYPHYQRENISRKWNWIHGRIPQSKLQSILRWYDTTVSLPKSVTRLMKVFLQEEDIGVSRWTTVFSNPLIDEMLNFKTRRYSRKRRYEEQFAECLEKYSHDKDTLSSSLFVDLTSWLPDDLLMKLDRMTMAHSVEARAPFLDKDVVSIAVNMLPKDKRYIIQNKKGFEDPA